MTGRRRRTPARRLRGKPALAVAVLVAVLAVGGLLATLYSAGAGGAPASSRPTATPGSPSSAPAQSPSPSTSPATSPAGGKPLAGKVVGIDPGHNGLNYTDPAFIDHKIWNGREWENCNTTGTATAGGYTEAQYNFNVASYLAAYLRADGARVVLTRPNNHGIGPCVNRRIQIINQAHADVAIDIHADSGPSWGRGFTVLEPVADGPNNKIITPSLQFGNDVRAALLAHSPMKLSNYYGQNGIILRNNLAGLNLAALPIVLIECGNMANAADARLLTSPVVQRQIARSLEAAIVKFLTG